MRANEQIHHDFTASISYLIISSLTTIHLLARVAFAGTTVMAPFVTVFVEPNPTAMPTMEKGLSDMFRVDALLIFLQLRNDLVIVVS